MNEVQDRLGSLTTTLENLSRQMMISESQRDLVSALEMVRDIQGLIQDGEEQMRLAALFQVSQSLGTSLDPDVVLTQVMDAVIELTQAERGVLLLHDERADSFLVHASRNFHGETIEDDTLKISQTVVRTALTSGVGVITTNAQEDPRFANQASVVLFSLRSIMVAPLRVRGKSIGVIYVDNRARVGNFDEQDLQLLTTFAGQAAIAIDNARLFTQVDQKLALRVQELELLTRINQELNARLDLQAITDATCSWAVHGTGAERAWIALTQRDNPTMVLASGDRRGEFLEPLPPIAAQVLEKGTAQTSETAPGELNQIAAPLRIAEQTFGILVVENQAPFESDALTFLVRLSARAASAIQNGRLFEEVDHANQAKSKFISVVSHELRLPMTSIKGYTDLILQGLVGEISDQQRDFLNIIRNNVERMTTLVSDLSDVNRIESGRLGLQPSVFGLHQVVDDVARSLGPKMRDKNQVLQNLVPAGADQVYADQTRTAQVLMNLVSNAWKYSPSGTEVTVSSERLPGGKIMVRVNDQGIGISEEDQDKLFTQFFRSEDSSVREQQGWGLGLNLAKNLVEIMGGEMGFKSQKGQGSTFWFTLPLE